MSKRSCVRSSLAASKLMLIIFLFSACGVRRTRSPPRPRRQIPRIKQKPPAPGYHEGQIALDVTKGRAKVYRFLPGSSWTVWSGSSRPRSIPLCITPCVANLKRGVHTLRFKGKKNTRLSGEMNVEVGRSPIVARMAMGKMRPASSPALHGAGRLAISIGSIVAIVGGIMWAVNSSKGKPIFLGGAAGALAGALIIELDPITFQRSSSRQWKPKDGKIYRH